MNAKRKRGFVIKTEGLALIEQKMRDKGYSRDKLAELAEKSIDTVNALFQGERKEKATIQAIATALELKPTDIVDADEWYPQSENTGKNQTDNDYWLTVCHTKLDDQQEQQRIRRKASEMGFELNVHVPLGLVEREKQQRRDENVDRSQVYQLEKEVTVKIYEHKDFLKQVINRSPAGKNKHIAIVGEPGAGKTTLLGAIATYIKEENKELPIFISLGSLEGMTLEKYLLKKWLPDAMRLVNPDFTPTPEIEEQLKSRFCKDGVWLLLDGVDEMGESSPIQALRKISQALTDWLGKARVVLTCRLNVWDASLTNNVLPGFDTYKTQDFKSEEVDNFIEDWFKCGDKMQRGEELKAKLREPGKERIRELVTNPLRLSLLCQIFYQNQHGELPETKAGLFDLYTQYFYDWKPEIVTQNLNYTLKQELHNALGRLALAGINSDARFRLNESLAVKEMGQSLFDLASRELGWLNLVDRDASSDEAVYAFFHPNFQEYFAALVIDDWHYFLNHIPHNPNEGIYRVFEPKWKEVILLWLGQKKEEISHHLKEELMKELINFKDDCGDFYRYKSYFLAVAGTSEFNQSIFTDEIIEQVIKWTFRIVKNTKNNPRINYSLEQEFKISLLQANSHRLIHGLTTELLSNQALVNHLEIALVLLEKVPDNQIAIKIIVDYLDKCQEEYNQTKLINLQSSIVKRKLEKFAPTNPLAISTLARLSSNQEQNELNTQIPSKIDFDSLFKLPTGNRNDIEKFIKLLLEIDLDSIKKSIRTVNDIDVLIGLIGRKLIFNTSINGLEYLKLIVDVLDKLNTSHDDLAYGFIKDINSVATDRLVEIASSNSIVIANLFEILDHSDDRKTKQKCLEILGKAASKNINATVALVNFLQTTEDYLMGMDTIYFIKKIIKSDLLTVVIKGLKNYIEDIEVYEILWHCSQNMTYPEFYRAWHGESSTIENLEKQFTDTHSLLTQLQPTNKIYPLPLNLKTLAGETENSTISQEICNQIYFTAFNETEEIPEVNNAPQLKRIIPQVKKRLQTENLALIINNCEPNEAIIKFCYKLTDVLHIAFITEQPLDAPLKGFLANQPNLLGAVQTWISEIG